MNLSQLASGPEPNCASTPLMSGTLPVATHFLISVSSNRVVERNFLAVSFCSFVALEEIDVYWPGLPTVSLGSPLSESDTLGKLVYTRWPPLTRSPPAVLRFP